MSPYKIIYEITADKVNNTGFQSYAVPGSEIGYPSLSKLKDRKRKVKAGKNGTVGYQRLWTQRRT